MDLLHFTPSDLENIVFFLLPGFLFIFLFFYQIPDKKKSDFIIIFVSVIFSAILHFFTTSLFNAITFITHLKWTIPSENLWTNWVSIFLGIILSIILARLLRSDSKILKAINDWIFKVEQYPFGTMWNAFLKMTPDSYVKVTVQDGTVYVGKLGRVSNESDDDMQEIELLKPFIFNKLKKKITRIIETDTMMIQGAAISSIEKITDQEAQKLYRL